MTAQCVLSVSLIAVGLGCAVAAGWLVGFAIGRYGGKT